MFGDEHNLPSIIKNERSVTWEKAILITGKIHDDEVNKFINLSQRLPLFDEATNTIVEKYIKLLEFQMAGNIVWSESDTKRYQFSYHN